GRAPPGNRPDDDHEPAVGRRAARIVLDASRHRRAHQSPDGHDRARQMTDRAPLSREIAIAAAAIEALRVGRALPAALDTALAAAARTAPALSGPSRAAVRDMAHQAARQLGLLGVLTATLNRRPPSPSLAALQIVALSQLLEPIRAEAIIVDQAVEAARAAPGTAP